MRRRLACSSSLILLILFSSCVLPGWPWGKTRDYPAEQSDGAMLLRHGSWLYRAGGVDEANSTSPSVKYALIGETGILGAWQRTAPLPEGIRQGAAFAAGNLAYVLGGQSDSGISPVIFYTFINPDGELGYGADRHWERNARALPEPRTGAAWALHDGWIFLFGGRTSAGTTDSIIRARIWQDGQIGQWYGSRQTLTGARWGAASAIREGRLYIAGGADDRSRKAEMLSFSLGDYGSLSDRRIEPDLPIALQEAILLTDEDDLILAGGYGDEGWSSRIFRFHDGAWTDTSLVADAEGSSFVKAGGNLFYLPLGGKGEDAGAARLDGMSLAPDRPIVLPGSGMVPRNSPVLVGGEPGVALRYREDQENPSVSDATWPSPPIKISASTLPGMRLAIAGFSPDGSASPPVFREYRQRSGSLFVVIEDTLQIHDSGSAGLDYRRMQESGAPGSMPTATSSLWLRIRIESTDDYLLSWADADEDSRFSSRLMLSVYESDLYTEVPDAQEYPSYDRRGGLAEPLRLSLNAGDYFLHIRDIDGREGRDFGISILRL